MPAKPTRKLAARRARVEAIAPILNRTYPRARCSLNYRNPFELIVATILSAQCTDERVNIVTGPLFAKYPDARALASAPEGELERDIQSTGFYRAKAKSLRGMARGLLERHGGQPPRSMEELTALPGVGRKTANVVLGNAYGQNVGITVDTHVTRLSNRLGLTDHAADAVKIERDLMQVVPPADWTIWSHLMIFHGRAVCTARKPNCRACPLLAHCPAGPRLIKAGKARD